MSQHIYSAKVSNTNAVNSIIVPLSRGMPSVQHESRQVSGPRATARAAMWSSIQSVLHIWDIYAVCAYTDEEALHNTLQMPCQRICSLVAFPMTWRVALGLMLFQAPVWQQGRRHISLLLNHVKCPQQILHAMLSAAVVITVAFITTAAPGTDI